MAKKLFLPLLKQRQCDQCQTLMFYGKIKLFFFFFFVDQHATVDTVQVIVLPLKLKRQKRGVEGGKQINIKCVLSFLPLQLHFQTNPISPITLSLISVDLKQQRDRGEVELDFTSCSAIVVFLFHFKGSLWANCGWSLMPP